MQLEKFMQGLGKEIAKVEPTPMDDEAIVKFITAHNKPIAIVTNYSIIRFKKSKNKEEENPAE